MPSHRFFRAVLLALLVSLLATISLSSSSASAFTGEGHVYLGPSAANATALGGWGHWGIGAQLGLVLGLSDFLKLSAGLEGSYHFADRSDPEQPIDPFGVAGAFVGARYALDVFTYVPYVGLAITTFAAGPPTSPDGGGFDLGAKLTLGLDYRFSRFWSFGILADLHASLTEPANFPLYSSVNLHLARHFRW
jgi:hypothetical protein